MEIYNETYSCRHRKYTINIPHQLFDELTIKVKEIDEDMPVAVYLRMLLRREVQKKRIIDEKEVLFPTEEIIPAPVRKKWKINVKSFLDRCRSRQLYFW
jgi:hypothetical protein